MKQKGEKQEVKTFYFAKVNRIYQLTKKTKFTSIINEQGISLQTLQTSKEKIIQCLWQITQIYLAA